MSLRSWPPAPSARAAHTSSSNSTETRRDPSTMSRSDIRPDWKDWEDLAIRVEPLPPPLATTLQLDTHFRQYGEVIYIEIFQSRQGFAIVRFSPPPSTECWHDPKVIKIMGQKHRIGVKFLGPRRPPIDVRTPGGHEYPPQLTIKPEKLQFGLLSRPNEFMSMRTVKNTVRDNDITFLADIKSRKLEITFSCIIEDLCRIGPKVKNPRVSTYKARIFFSHLTNLVVLEGESEFSVLIPLQSPPIYFKKGDRERSHSEGKSSWSESDTWNRVVDIVYDTSRLRHDKITLRREDHFVDIGRWTTYKVIFAKSNIADWENMKRALQDFNISVWHFAADRIKTVPAAKSYLWELLEPETTSGNLALLAASEEVNLPFEVRYQLEVCISQGRFHEINLSSEFLRKLTELSNARKRNRNRAKDLLTYVAESGDRDTGRELELYPNRLYNPIELFTNRKALSYYPELGVPSHCVWVRKVVVTPSTIYLSTPTPEASNRVLRHFAQYSDRFLRVQFTDELMKGRIYSSPNSMQQHAVYNRIHRTLANGIKIAGRHFEFLAFGNSQFRENGAYFFSPTDGIDCDYIRNWMGDVAHIRVVAKYAARLGQCFSTTRAFTDSPISQSVHEIEDIFRNDWCFTDGVGKISPRLAGYVAKRHKLASKNIPSAFQFRLGGNKGLLVVWPDLNFNQVCLRPSQKKFHAQSTLLEIIKPSRFSVATLNRQTITILSCLGVPDSAFLNLQQNQLIGYDRAMEDPATAMRLLSQFVDQNGITTMVAQMISDGFMRVKEPFFMCILQVWRAWSLRLLREKARIVVEQGAFVFGCIDETCTLRGYYEPKDGSPSEQEFPQIFLQVPRPGASPDDQNNYMVVTGLCVVGRNPSLHPGDLRVAEAVDVPALQHLRDVVVFPANGDRDIPSMCSGGDLDGDDFFVIWDPNLIPPEERNYPPMIHEPVQPVELNRDVRPSDLIAFFVMYMKNDALSTIAHAHLAQSDKLMSQGGPKHETCVELAHLHSKAVDYPKSGQPAYLESWLRPRQYPHFMEKPSKSYHSKTVLGQLYDVVSKVEFRPDYNNAFDERILRRFKLADDILRKARIIKRQHDRALRKIMNQREIGTEFEVWSTFVLTKPRVGSEYQMQETMGPIIANHRDRFRKACIRVAGSHEPEVLYPFVAAAYRVTWEAVQVGRIGRTADQRVPFISFPWVFEQELGRIANLQQDCQLDSLPGVSLDAIKDEDEEDETEYDQLLGLGLFDPTLEEVEVEGEEFGVVERNVAIASEPTQPTEELVVLEEDVETGMDELEKLAGVGKYAHMLQLSCESDSELGVADNAARIPQDPLPLLPLQREIEEELIELDEVETGMDELERLTREG
ncbi:RNA dependent RNA polymerase-domain-containing protein [Xylaria scruposa]|nr:RNA dependent RNA polymerase-domain-containing protein [Xylaria scruposa]